jgi:hypothetical protein
MSGLLAIEEGAFSQGIALKRPADVRAKARMT